MSQKKEKCCSEPMELIDLCVKCEKRDCDSEDGCAEYIALKQQLAPKKKRGRPPAAKEAPVQQPAMMIEAAPEKLFVGTANALQKCNAAIEALEALYNDDSSSLIFDTETIRKTLQSLKEARIQEYGAMIDWNAIAERIKNHG